MPYLQLDVNGHYATSTKQLLATRMAETYAALMAADIKRITVTIRELGDGVVYGAI